MTPYEIRRLRPDEVDAALDLAMVTCLEFEATGYGPKGVAALRRDIYDNAGFRPAGAEQTINDIRFTPMTYDL